VDSGVEQMVCSFLEGCKHEDTLSHLQTEKKENREQKTREEEKDGRRKSGKMKRREERG
jgi:hypothetical protein